MKAFREEIAELYEIGCRRIQFDDPGFAFYCSGVTIAGMEARGVDREKLLSMHIDVYNAITVARPEDLVITVHTCRCPSATRHSGSVEILTAASGTNCFRGLHHYNRAHL